jgi:hypothetical protein
MVLLGVLLACRLINCSDCPFILIHSSNLQLKATGTYKVIKDTTALKLTMSLMDRNMEDHVDFLRSIFQRMNNGQSGAFIYFRKDIKRWVISSSLGGQPFLAVSTNQEWAAGHYNAPESCNYN